MPHLLVVGAGPGISQASARAFGRAGYAVSLVARSEERLAVLGAALREEAIDVGWTVADAGDPAGLTAAIDGSIARTGPVDVLLFNAVAMRMAGPAELSPEQFAADLGVGVVGLHTAVRAVLPGMRERGSGTVLVTGGGAADDPAPAVATLGVQKAALRALVVTLAAVLAPEGVHVATATVRERVAEDAAIHPDAVASLYAELVAETAGPAGGWRTVVDVPG